MQRVLNEIKSRVNSAQVDLDNAKNGNVEVIPGDKFVDVMEVMISFDFHLLLFQICIELMDECSRLGIDFRDLLITHGTILNDLKTQIFN